MILSGTVAFEGRGLVSTQYVQKKWSSSGAYVVSPPKEKPTRFYYDWAGRCYQTDYPDGTHSSTYRHELYQEDTDQSGNKVRTNYDAYGRVLSKENVGGSCTWYAYDALGRCTASWDRANNTATGFKNTNTYDALGRKTQSVDMDMGTWTYSYDKNGNLISQKDAKGKITKMTYDALNRVLTKDCADTVAANTINIDYTYDTGTYGVGRLSKEVSVSNGETVTTTFTYNYWGDVTKNVKTIGTTAYPVTTAIDMLERPTSVTYPDGTVVYYSYNANNGSLAKVGSAAGGNQYLREIRYDNYGLVTGKVLGNGVLYGTDYDYTTFRVNHIYADLGTARKMSNWYSYYPNGNVKNIANDVTNYNWGYEYDSSNRVTRAYRGTGTNPSSNTYNKTYTYNNNNSNIATFEGKTYAYGNTAHKHAATSNGTNTYAYDANGNMTSVKNSAGAAVRTITWSMSNKPISVVQGSVTSKFVYDGEDARVKKNVGTAWRVYIGGIYEQDSTGNKECFIDLGGVTVKKETNGTTTNVFYILKDHLGSSSVILKSDGTVSAQQYYYPFGSDDTVGAIAGEVDFHKFTGQEQVKDTGLYYYGGRFYDAALGSFVSADPIMGMNRYAYCANNPINATDPSGYQFDILGWIKYQSSFEKCQERYGVIDETLNHVMAPIEDASDSAACEAHYNGLQKGANDAAWQANRVGNNLMSDNIFQDEPNGGNITIGVMPSIGIGPGNGASAWSLLKQTLKDPWVLANLASTGGVKWKAAKDTGASDSDALWAGFKGVVLTIPASIGPGMVKYSERVRKGSIADYAVNHIGPAEYRALRAKVLNQDPNFSWIDAHVSQGTNLAGSLAFGALGGRINKYTGGKITQFAVSQGYSTSISNYNFYLEQTYGTGLYTVEGMQITASYFGM